MFWRVTTFTPLSPIEAILDKESFTLDELLNEEDIIQECKSANSRLVQYLGNPKVLEQLLWYLTENAEDDLHFKYSYTACEIFCCELDDVLSNLITSDELMERLFSPLSKPPPLNSTLAGYFGRVVGCLLVKRAPDTHKWLAAHPEVLPALVRHVYTTSTVEVILRLVGADEIAAAGGPSTASEWLSETMLMDQLLETLVSPKSRGARAARIQRAAQQNVGEILVHVARHQCASMISQLTAPDYLARMLEAAAAPDSEVLQPVLKVAIALLSPRVPTPVMQPPPLALGLMPTYEQPVEQPSKVDVHEVATEVVRFIPHLTEMLTRPSPTAVASQELPYGVLTPPLGRQRITVIELGQALLATNESVAVRAMIDCEFIPRAMDLFQQYPFNSILHTHVLDMLGTLIDALTPSHTGDGGHNPGPAMSTEGPIGVAAMHSDDAELLSGVPGGPMGDGQHFIPSLGPGFDFSTPAAHPEPPSAPPIAAVSAPAVSAPDSSVIITPTSLDALFGSSSAQPDTAEAPVGDPPAPGDSDASTATTAATGAMPPGADAASAEEGGVGVPTDVGNNDNDEEDDSAASAPPPPPPQRNIVSPGSIGGPSAAVASAAGSGTALGAGLLPEAVAVGEGDESAAVVDSGVDKFDVHDGDGAAIDDEEETEIGDDQNILECLLDKVNIIGWLLKLNGSTEAGNVSFQPGKDVKTPLRAAYHGHLTQLAAKLQASKHGLLQATLDMNREWQSFKTSYLDNQLVLEDRSSWEVDLPPEHNSPDELTDPGACQMDVYSQSDFDNTEDAWRMQLLQGDMFSGVPMAGRYTLDDDDDEYADADLSMFDDDADVGGMRSTLDGEIGGPHSHTIDAGGGIMSQEGGGDELAAAVRAGGFSTSMLMGRGISNGGLVEHMQGLGIGAMDAAAVDEDDEVVMGVQDDDIGMGLRNEIDAGPGGPHTHHAGQPLHQTGDDFVYTAAADAASEFPGDAPPAAPDSPPSPGTMQVVSLSADAGGMAGGAATVPAAHAADGGGAAAASSPPATAAEPPSPPSMAVHTAGSSRDDPAAEASPVVGQPEQGVPVALMASGGGAAGSAGQALMHAAASVDAHEAPREVPSHRVEAEAVTVGSDEGSSSTGR